MNPSTQDRIEGAIHEVKGKVKETAGQVLNQPDLEVEGKTENFGGKVQKKVGQVEQVFEK
ncbi:MAG: CsbD family protein [Bryobacteraceae bacterium]